MRLTQIRDFVRMAFAEIGVELAFEGKDENFSFINFDTI